MNSRPNMQVYGIPGIELYNYTGYAILVSVTEMIVIIE